jgi:hypothetical protein
MKISLLLIIVITITFFDINAQDLEPRSLSPAPVGMNIVLAGYSYSHGNILTDAALPIEGLNAKINSFIGAYVRTIDFFGLSGKVDIIVPYSFGTWEGEVYDIDSSVSRAGISDPLARLSVSLLGGPAQSISEFKGTNSNFTLGASLRVRIPLGQYDNTKLINLGSNRWMFKPSIGMSYKAARWVFEFHLSSWLFTTNNEYYNGNELKQNPMYSGQVHAIYSFKAGFWAALSYGLVTGGETTMNGEYKNDTQSSEKVGAVLIFPFSMFHSIKLGFTSGISARYGSKFDSYVLAYQFRWF